MPETKPSLVASRVATRAADGEFLAALYQRLTGRKPTHKEIGNARKWLNSTSTLPPGRTKRDPADFE